MSLCNILLHPMTRQPWPDAPISVAPTYLVPSPGSWLAQWAGDSILKDPSGLRHARWTPAHPLGRTCRAYEAVGRNGEYSTQQTAADALWHKEFDRLIAGLRDCARAWRLVHALRNAIVGPMTQHGTLMVMNRYLAMKNVAGVSKGPLPDRSFYGMGLSMWSDGGGGWYVSLPPKVGHISGAYVHTRDPACVIAEGLTTHEANIKAALLFIEGVDCATVFFDCIRESRGTPYFDILPQADQIAVSGHEGNTAAVPPCSNS